MKVGTLRGSLTLTFPDAEPLNLGTIDIPLEAVNASRVHSGSDEISIRIAANLEKLRDNIQALFNH